MKYVIMEDACGISYPFIFRKLYTHADMKPLADRNGYQIVSAGFVQITADGEFKCYGESVSLKLKSRPDDSDILNMCQAGF